MVQSTAIDPAARASVVGIETKFQNISPVGSFLPQRVAVIGQGATAVTYATTKQQVLSAFEVGEAYGFGSPLHLAITKILPANGDGVGSIPVTVYPLEDAGTAIAAAGDITPVGTQTVTSTYRVAINNILSNAFSITTTDTIATIVTKITNAINGVVEMPVIATDSTTIVDLVAKWAGESGNDLKIEIIGDITTGITFALTQFTGGAVNPDVQVALDQFGETWETLVLNCLNKSDTDALEKYHEFGEGRWLSTVKKPCVVFSGETTASVATATAIPDTDARRIDRTNSQLVAPGSDELPFLVAARQLARIAVVAENNPPTGYNGKIADQLVPGADADQWSYLERDNAVKKGSSTATKENGNIVLGDIITFYHPNGQEVPAYRYVVNIIKLQNIIYLLNTTFMADEWRAAPLLPDGEPTVNPNARTPGSARAEIAGILDFLGQWAFISNAAEAKKLTIAQIDVSNPNRLDIEITVKLSGNSRIIAITQNFTYFFGGL
jgi:phage tail sheath gpL-like